MMHRRLKYAVVLAVVSLFGTLALSFPQGRTTATQDRLRKQGEEIARHQEKWYGYKGVITGRVRLSDGKPAAGFKVAANFVRHATGASGEGFALTDADGVYRIYGLSTEEFRVRAETSGTSYIEDSPRVVALDKASGAKAENVDFSLTLGPEIAVRVRDAQTGVAVSGVEVSANQSRYSSPQTIGTTDAAGEFRFRTSQLETEIHLMPPNRDRNRVLQAAPGTSFYRRITFDSAAATKDTVWDVKTYAVTGLSNENEMVFRGVVTGPDNKPVPGALVRLMRYQGGKTVGTDANGRFSITGPRMRTDEFGTWDRVTRRGLRFEAEKGDLTAAHYATPDETWTVIPIRLTRDVRASVTGRVVGTDGKPIAGVPIHYSGAFLDAEAYTQKNVAASDAEGRFLVQELWPDAYYQFAFGKPAGNGNDFGFGLTKIPEVPYTNGQMRLKEGERRDMGQVVVLRSDSALAGRLVTLTGGVPTGQLMIVIEGRHTQASVMMDPGGRFRFARVVREPLTLGVFAPDADAPHFFRTDLKKPGAALPRTVQGGDENITVTLL